MLSYIALALTGVKIIKDIGLGVIKAKNTKLMFTSRQFEGERCIFLPEENGKCTNIFYKKQFDRNNGQCLRNKCWGFWIRTEKEEHAVTNNPIIFVINKTIDCFPAISAFLLALNEILTSNVPTT